MEDIAFKKKVVLYMQMIMNEVLQRQQLVIIEENKLKHQIH